MSSELIIFPFSIDPNKKTARIENIKKTKNRRAATFIKEGRAYRETCMSF